MKDNNVLKVNIIVNLFWKFGERLAAQLISLVVSIILARLLSPDEYGAVAIVMIFITIANVFVSSGFGNALIQKKNADNLDFSTVFYINLVLGVILYVIVYLTAPLIASFYDLPILEPALRVLGIRIIVASINSVQQAYISRKLIFKRFFISTIFGTLISGFIGVCLAYKGYGVWALVVQYLSNAFISTIILWFTVNWRPEFKCSFTRAKSLFSYGWKLLLSSLLDTGYRQLRSLIIGKKYTSAELAYYNQGDKYPSLIVTNINVSISSVIFPAMSQNQDDKERVKQMTRRAIQLSSFIMWPLMIGLGTVAEPLVSILLTDKWLPCVPYIRIFCFTYGLWPIHTANLQAINALGRSDLFLKLEIIKKTIGIGTVLITMHFGPLIMAFSIIITDIIATVINAFPNKKLLNYSFWEQIKDMLPALAMSMIMSIIISLINLMELSAIVTILIQIVCGMIIYFSLAILTKQDILKYLFELTRRK